MKRRLLSHRSQRRGSRPPRRHIGASVRGLAWACLAMVVTCCLPQFESLWAQNGFPIFETVRDPVDGVSLGEDSPSQQELLYESQLVRERDRRRLQLLTRHRELVAAGAVDEALQMSQAIRQFGGDAFIWNDALERPVSVFGQIRQSEFQLAKNNRDAFDNLSSIAATAVQKKWLAFGSRPEATTAELDRQLAWQFASTEAGQQALQRKIQRAVDRGEFDIALRAAEIWYSTALARSANARLPFRPAQIHVLQRAALAAVSQGDETSRQRWSERLRRHGGQPVKPFPNRQFQSPWWSSTGSRQGSSAVSAGLPVLRPSWAIPFAASANGQSSGSELAAFLTQRSQQSQPVSIANTPLVVGERVIYRDHSCVRAVDVQSGNTLWRFPCQKISLAADNSSRVSRTDPFVNSRESSDVGGSAAVDNQPLQLLSSDGQRVFLIDDVQVKPPQDAKPPAFGRARFRRETSPPVRNRLIALPVYGDTRTANDRLTGPVPPSETLPADSATRATEETPSVGRPQPEWTFEPVSEDGERFVFRGPPLFADGQLFVLLESDSEFALWCLAAETGQALWRQPLSYPTTALSDMRQRQQGACQIAAAGGVVVCPNLDGSVVAFDTLQGQLLWALPLEDLTTSPRRTSRYRSLQKLESRLGFSITPMIADDRVLLLQPESEVVVCADLLTGKLHWTAPRGDSFCLATASDGVVLLLERRGCRAVSLRDGSELWKQTPGAIAGRGLLTTAGTYLLPLQDGRIVRLPLRAGGANSASLSAVRFPGINQLPPTIDAGVFAQVSNGEGSGAGLAPQEQTRPVLLGNLVPAGDRILSSSITGLLAMPQVRHLQPQIARQLQVRPDDPALLQQAAELDLLQGDFDQAQARLERVIQLADDAERNAIERQYVRLLFVRLANQQGNDDLLLEQLAARVATPADRGRFLFEAAAAALRNRRWLPAHSAIDRLNEFAQQQRSNLLITTGSDQNLDVSPATLVGQLHRQLMRSDLPPDVRSRIEDLRDAALSAAIQSRTEPVCNRVLTRYGDHPGSAPVRVLRGELVWAQGRFQQAEMDWLSVLETAGEPDGEVNAAVAQPSRMARMHLLELYQNSGFDQAALQQWQALRAAQPFTSDVEESTLGVSENVRFAARQQTPQRMLPGLLTIRNTLHAEDGTSDVYDPSRRAELFREQRRFSLPSRFPLAVFARLPDGAPNETLIDVEVGRDHTNATGGVAGDLVVVDSRSGAVRGTIHSGTSISWPAIGNDQPGHFLPLGNPGKMVGISLLTLRAGGIAWKKRFPHHYGLQSVARPGPAGHDFAVFQAGQTLCVVSPRDGQLLWRRNLDDPTAGLVSDPRAGIIGDEQVLVVFDKDQQRYQVFETRTGVAVRTGVLTISRSKVRRQFGRRLFYMPEDTDDLRLRIWDPLTNTHDLDAEVDKVVTGYTPDGELTLILNPAKGQSHFRLQVRDVVNNRVQIEIPLTSEQYSRCLYVRAVRHFDRYYISLQAPHSERNGAEYRYFVSDMLPANVAVQGEFFAVDAATSQLLWTQRLGQCTLLTTPHERLPALVFLSRVRSRQNVREQRFHIEVLDLQTGQKIKIEKEILPDRYLQSLYHPDLGQLELIGRRSRVTIDFPIEKPESLVLPVPTF